MYVELVIFVSLSYTGLQVTKKVWKKVYGSDSFPTKFLNILTFCAVKTFNPAKGKCFDSGKGLLRPMVSCSYKHIHKAQQNEQNLPTLKSKRTKTATAWIAFSKSCLTRESTSPEGKWCAESSGPTSAPPPEQWCSSRAYHKDSLSRTSVVSHSSEKDAASQMLAQMPKIWNGARIQDQPNHSWFSC